MVSPYTGIASTAEGLLSAGTPESQFYCVCTGVTQGSQVPPSVSLGGNP
jgi:hypothetical protein